MFTVICLIPVPSFPHLFSAYISAVYSFDSSNPFLSVPPPFSLVTLVTRHFSPSFDPYVQCTEIKRQNDLCKAKHILTEKIKQNCIKQQDQHNNECLCECVCVHTQYKKYTSHHSMEWKATQQEEQLTFFFFLSFL